MNNYAKLKFFNYSHSLYPNLTTKQLIPNPLMVENGVVRWFGKAGLSDKMTFVQT